LVTIELKIDKTLPLPYTERKMIITERFISDLVQIHEKHPIVTIRGTWYQQARRILKLKLKGYCSYEKNLRERTIKYIKARTKENFDETSPFGMKKCNIHHMIN
jgi:hypothetical protein